MTEQPIRSLPENTPEVEGECAMFAVYLFPGKAEGIDVQRLIYQGLTEQQARAEGAAGMYVSNGSDSAMVKELGTVAVAFQEGRNLPDVDAPRIGIGHTRYPTAGRPNHKANIQPQTVEGITLAHHGNLTNMSQIREGLEPFPMGGEFPDNDTWIATNAIAQASGASLGEKVTSAQANFEGAWDFLVSDGNSLVASRDPHGIRPFSYVRLGPEDDPIGYAFAVEDSAFSKLPKRLQASEPVEFLRGQTLQVDERGLHQIELRPASRGYFCVFEYIYMSRPDTTHNGVLVSQVRRRIGEFLARDLKRPTEKLLVMPVPDSGRSAAVTYAKTAREMFDEMIGYEEGIIANRYYGRNFIKSADQRHANLKFSALPNILQGQHIVLVDDSLVRGDTMRDLIQLCREAGAATVDVVIASPAIKYKCLWGVAFPTNEELLANKYPNEEERRRFIGADNLLYLPFNDLKEAVREDIFDQCCTYCLDGRNGPPMSVDGVVSLNEVFPLEAVGRRRKTN